MANEEMEMRCRQLFELLSEFIDGQLDEARCREIQAHLADCPPCDAFLNTLQKTVEACQKLPCHSLPEETRRELKEMLQAELVGWRQDSSS
jgi:RNA polymerase sigma-70 factor (ECF subfamily)